MLTVTSLILITLGGTTVYGCMTGNFTYITLGVLLSIIFLTFTIKDDVDSHNRKKASNESR